jgi:hypothetical protein
MPQQVDTGDAGHFGCLSEVQEARTMKLRHTVVAMALSVFAVGPVFAGGAASGCDYGSKYRYTAAEPEAQSEAAKKLASLSATIGEQEMVASTPEKSDAGTSQAAKKTTAQ